MYRNVFGLVISLLVISTFAAEYPTDPIGQRCLNQTETDPAVLVFKHAYDAITNPKTQCYTACFYREGHVVDAKGSLNELILSDHIAKNSEADKTAIADELKRCNSEVINDTDLCQVIVKRMLCIMESPITGSAYRKNR